MQGSTAFACLERFYTTRVLETAQHPVADSYNLGYGLIRAGFIVFIHNKASTYPGPRNDATSSGKSPGVSAQTDAAAEASPSIPPRNLRPDSAIAVVVVMAVDLELASVSGALGDLILNVVLVAPSVRVSDDDDDDTPSVI
ncbi:hypothetical protein APSETT444_000191 [Aspergillus pseudonomiae]